MGALKLVDCKDVSHKLLVGLHKSWLSGKYASPRHSVPNEPVSVNFCPLNFFYFGCGVLCLELYSMGKFRMHQKTDFFFLIEGYMLVISWE